LIFAGLKSLIQTQESALPELDELLSELHIAGSHAEDSGVESFLALIVAANAEGEVAAEPLYAWHVIDDGELVMDEVELLYVF
jgi:hypothetical protein